MIKNMYKILKCFELYEPINEGSEIRAGITTTGQIFSIPLSLFKNHLVIFGKTNTGKSTVLLNIADQLINKNQTLILIDPHGDLAISTIKTIPKLREKDLVYITPNFLKIDNEYYSITMNALHINFADDPIQKEMERLRAIDNIKLLFSKDERFSMGTWGPRLELVFSVLTRALLEIDENATITDLLDILIDKEARSKFLRLTKDEDVSNFLRDLYKSKINTDYVTSSINKLLPIKKNIFIRELVASKRESINFESLLSNESIIIVNLSKSNISESLSGMVGSLIINMIWNTALKLNLKKQLFLIVDELQNFNALNLKNMLSEGRKYGLSMILATQHLNQIQSDLLDSIIGNVSSIGAFTIGAVDANMLKSLFSPYPGANEKICYLLQNLDRNKMLFKTIINNKHTILTLNTFDHVDKNIDIMALIEASVKKYGIKIEMENKNYDFVLYAISQLQNRKNKKLKFEEIYKELRALKNIEISELDLILRNYQSRNLIHNDLGFYTTVDGEKYLGSISEVERKLSEGEYHRYLLNRACQYLASMNVSCTILEQSNREMPDAIIKMNGRIINVEAEFGELTKKVTILNHFINFKNRQVIFLTFKEDAKKLYGFLKAPYRVTNENQAVPYLLDGEPLDWTKAGNILKKSRIWIVPEPGEIGTMKEYKEYK